jgi:hypothetical protein
MHYGLQTQDEISFKEMNMNTKYVENGLALMGALLVLVAVAFAANSVLDGELNLDFPTPGYTSTLVASS